jgi:RimJ/RimL family protein N-acetyltransferase
MSERATAAEVRIEPWGEDDLPLLRRANAPEMTEHLGGPESEEKVLDRHRGYVGMTAGAATGAGVMFRVVLLPGLEKAGTIGYWERPWRDAVVYETGWTVLPEFQGRGIAVAAARAVVARARAERRHRFLYAFPSVGNPASNAICRRAGFSLVGECEFEFPPGRLMRSNEWRLDLAADAGGH